MVDARAFPFREVVRFLFFEGAFLILYGSCPMGGSGFFGGLGRRLYGILEEGHTRERENSIKKQRIQ